MFYQNYNPTGNVLLSTFLAAVPILVLLYFIAIHPSRDATGKRHLGIAAPYAAFAGVIAAFLISCVAFHMPVVSAISAFALGTLSGFLGIIWIVVGAILAVGANAALAYFVFEVKWPVPSAVVVLGGWAAVSALTVATGLFSNRGICDHPPLAVLREET